jgi:hypothetical protein
MKKPPLVSQRRLFKIDHRDEDIRPWQAWQRPTLPSLET